jgi:hypothetical protein
MTRSGGARLRASLLGLAAALAAIALMVIAAVVTLDGGSSGAAVLGVSSRSGNQVSSFAQHQIPSRYLRLYQQAARRFGLDWAVLAGIGKVECDHGRDPDPSCTREGSVNSSGAGGPMQFIASTWQRYGIDGNADRTVDRWDPADAVYSAANYLRASGAPTDYARAVLAYNHAGWYVAEVMSWAARYRGLARSQAAVTAGGGRSESGAASFLAASPSPVRFVAGERALLAAEDQKLALVPTDVPPPVQAMVVAGNELQQLPYGPGGHPDPRGASEEDCSSTVNYLLYRSGARSIFEIVRDNPLAQDYVDWGDPGPGRWVTIYATTAPANHVFIVVAGLRLDTSHAGSDIGPNRAEDGPRWRLFGHIPTWAHWSVRHPPGL